MKKTVKGIIAMLLVVATIVCASLPAYAARAEEYLADLRIIYASDYDEALDILADSEFSDYYILDENLNEGTGEIGVWLAYKTTTDIEEAITDIAMMQEEGGYSLGNYQAMLAESKAEYDAMAAIYDEALQYFRFAYDEGDYLASAAYRQLNFYNVRTVGITDIPPFEGERLGDLFYNGIGTSDLATMFMEGNTYALDNVRSLLAMGVSYNEDGKHYLTKVGEAADAMNADASVYSAYREEYNKLGTVIASAILTFRDMFKEVELYEDELNYADEEMTEKEMKYVEYYSLALRFREVNYLKTADGKEQTLYDFCLAYDLADGAEEFPSLYPLAAALNDGQKAMTQVFHYYDVVRYSLSEVPEEKMDAEIAKLEETYGEYPFNIYEGVDRTIFKGDYALTTEALRATSSVTDGFFSWLIGEYPVPGIATIAEGGVGTILFVWGICRSAKVALAESAANRALEVAQAAFNNATTQAMTDIGASTFTDIAGYPFASSLNSGVANGAMTCNDVLNSIFTTYIPGTDPATLTAAQKIAMIQAQNGTAVNGVTVTIDPSHISAMDDIYTAMATKTSSLEATASTGVDAAKDRVAEVASMANNMSAVTATLYAVGGAMMLYSALVLGISLLCYYNPTYEKIPYAMVDMIETVDGDRYIKYDAVLEAETRKDTYIPADLNAYEGQHWNAMYYTKSYEAGKPLLADEFKVSSRSNKPGDNYMPVHRFGEEVCYNLNKYAFNDDTSIYLSVKQSENQKLAVAGVPEVVGSMLSTGFIALAGGLGLLIGVGATLGTQGAVKRGKAKAN